MNPLLNYRDASAYLGGVGRSTLERLRADGEIQSVAVRGRTMWVRASLDAYIARQQEAA